MGIQYVLRDILSSLGGIGSNAERRQPISPSLQISILRYKEAYIAEFSKCLVEDVEVRLFTVDTGNNTVCMARLLTERGNKGNESARVCIGLRSIILFSISSILRDSESVSWYSIADTLGSGRFAVHGKTAESLTLKFDIFSIVITHPRGTYPNEETRIDWSHYLNTECMKNEFENGYKQLQQGSKLTDIESSLGLKMKTAGFTVRSHESAQLCAAEILSFAGLRNKESFRCCFGFSFKVQFKISSVKHDGVECDWDVITRLMDSNIVYMFSSGNNSLILRFEWVGLYEICLYSDESYEQGAWKYICEKNEFLQGNWNSIQKQIENNYGYRRFEPVLLRLSIGYNKQTYPVVLKFLDCDMSDATAVMYPTVNMDDDLGWHVVSCQRKLTSGTVRWEYCAWCYAESEFSRIRSTAMQAILNGNDSVELFNDRVRLFIPNPSKSSLLWETLFSSSIVDEEDNLGKSGEFNHRNRP